MQKYLPFIMYYGSALLLFTRKVHCLQTFEHIVGVIHHACESVYNIVACTNKLTTMYDMWCPLATLEK